MSAFIHSRPTLALRAGHAFTINGWRVSTALRYVRRDRPETTTECSGLLCYWCADSFDSLCGAFFCSTATK
jgi:hypothetical protein